MSQIINGVIHGRTIELAEDLGLADGQPVTVIVQANAAQRQPGGGLARSAGSWAAFPEMDAIMSEIARHRKASLPREVVE